MNRIAKTIIIAATGAMTLNAAAWADPGLKPNVSTPSPTTVTTGSLSVTTGNLSNEPTAEQRMKDCMAIWDKGTHMTKDQWRRSCATTLQSLSTD